LAPAYRAWGIEVEGNGLPFDDVGTGDFVHEHPSISQGFMGLTQDLLEKFI
jgi:hypothetical protein